MDCTICTFGTSRRAGASSRVGAPDGLGEGAPRGRCVSGLLGSQMCFRFTKTSGRGIPPGPRTTFPRATRRLPGMARPRKPEAERGSRTNRRERGTRPADRPPRPAPALRPPVLPVSGAGGSRPSDRDVWIGSVPPSLRPGWGGDSTPAGGTDGVRAGGRGDRRRSGGNADHVARRSLRGLSREADGHRPAVIGRRRNNIRRRADRGDLRPPNRERCRSEVCAGGQRGRGPPPASAGDARSVAPRSKRITGGANHGRKPRKSNQDCTIRHFCRCTGPCWTVPRKRENRT